ncbi:MAG: D-glycero-beta-D-manno-heptose-7-phosphate kinase [Acidobacteria bacterium]|nr:D-glycero-beta-D-manno-heptose-7-phosphate kinase [Acidobacteriota bacterium]MCA1639128.1 D-glycero-beta-D-manno-heptose-7-phosphate kinase [Acidobacteriota bacterium]
MKILENFSKVKVLVVGDVMLDRFWWGNVSRISPEAPVPVVNLQNMSLVAGGAANVAANIAGLGAEPLLVGVIGEDEEAKLFPAILNKSKVSADFLVKISTRQTTIKTRVIAHSQQVVRIDQETKKVLNQDEEQKVWEKILTLLEKAEIVIISDYAKGVLTDNLLKRLIITTKKKNKIIVVDPKGKNYSKYIGATLLKPNQREAAEACNLDETERDFVEKSGSALLENLSVEALLITQGEKGMSLFQKNKEIVHFNSHARQVYDVTGAGDTVIASLAVALASGADFCEAAHIANISAGLVVEQIGTTAISITMLKNALENENL